MSTLEELFQELTFDAKRQVEDLVRFLVRKHFQSPANPSRTGPVKEQRESYTTTLPELIQSLPLEMQQEVQDYIEFLLEEYSHKPAEQFRLDWRGALRDLRDQYTSVELQHKIAEWWIGG